MDLRQHCGKIRSWEQQKRSQANKQAHVKEPRMPDGGERRAPRQRRRAGAPSLAALGSALPPTSHKGWHWAQRKEGTCLRTCACQVSEVISEPRQTASFHSTQKWPRAKAQSPEIANEVQGREKDQSEVSVFAAKSTRASMVYRKEHRVWNHKI